MVDPPPPLPPLSIYQTASIQEHRFGEVGLTTITDGRGIDRLEVKHHRVMRVRSATTCHTTWRGRAPHAADFSPGDTAFIPGRSETSVVASTPYSATCVLLPDRWLRDCVAGDLDYSQIDFHCGKMPHGPAASIIDAMESATTSPGFHWPELIEGLTVSLAATVVAGLTLDGKIFRAKNGLSSERKQRVLEYIDAHLSRPISLAELADVAALSQFHFARSFRISMGVSPLRYLLDRRVKQASAMLRQTKEPLVSVSASCGFSSQSHFTTAFKAATGATPGQYRVVS